MSRHVAEIRWRSDGNFRSGAYSRRHNLHFDGGLVVPGSPSPSIVPEPMSDPAAADPEELLVAAMSSCHMLWFLSLAQESGFEIETYSDKAEGVMGRIAPGRMAFTRIVLRPVVTFQGREPEAVELERLHHEAHERCFIANSLTSEVVIETPQAAVGTAQA